MKPNTLALFAALAACATACAGSPQKAYPGPERPPDELALLRGSSQARVLAIDGVRMRGLPMAWRIEPGSHDVVLAVRLYTTAPGVRGAALAYCLASFDAQAGVEYESRVRTEQRAGSGLTQRTQVEIGIADFRGKLVALASACSPERPRLGE